MPPWSTATTARWGWEAVQVHWAVRPGCLYTSQLNPHAGASGQAGLCFRAQLQITALVVARGLHFFFRSLSSTSSPRPPLSRCCTSNGRLTCPPSLPCSPPPLQVLRRNKTSKGDAQTRYYELAHSIQEEIVRQPVYLRPPSVRRGWGGWLWRWCWVWGGSCTCGTTSTTSPTPPGRHLARVPDDRAALDGVAVQHPP